MSIRPQLAYYVHRMTLSVSLVTGLHILLAKGAELASQPYREKRSGRLGGRRYSLYRANMAVTRHGLPAWHAAYATSEETCSPPRIPSCRGSRRARSARVIAPARRTFSEISWNLQDRALPLCFRSRYRLPLR